jgi:hypothetical protein
VVYVGDYAYVSDVLFFGHEFDDFACLSKLGHFLDPLIG